MNDETRKAMEELLKNADPEAIAKFGNPLDEDDPRTWTPTKRQEMELPREQRLELLELDVEAYQRVIAQMTGTMQMLIEYVRVTAMAEMEELIVTDPQKAIKKFLDLAKNFGPLLGIGPELLQGMVGNAPNGGHRGPLDDSSDSPVRYAGSTNGAKAEQMIDTPQGMIRVDQIPGYVDDPNWKPSPDWVDANCMCPSHQEMRKQHGTNPDDDSGFGMYL